MTVRDGGGWSHVAHNWKDLDVAATLRELPELEGASDEELCAMAAHSKLLTLPRYGKLWRKSTPTRGEASNSIQPSTVTSCWACFTLTAPPKRSSG